MLFRCIKACFECMITQKISDMLWAMFGNSWKYIFICASWFVAPWFNKRRTKVNSNKYHAVFFSKKRSLPPFHHNGFLFQFGQNTMGHKIRQDSNFGGTSSNIAFKNFVLPKIISCIAIKWVWVIKYYCNCYF